MNRVSLALVACLVACGGSKPKQQNLAPLPDDKPAEQTAKTEEPKKEEPPAEPPKPLGPVEVKVDVPAVTVKLVNAGKGKKAKLAYAPKAGTKQSLELVTAFAQSAKVGDQSGQQAVPPIVLAGEAETKAVDANGKADYTVTVSSVDAKPDPTNAVPVDKFKIAIASLAGLVISGSVEANGSMTEPVLRIEKPDQFSIGALDLLRQTLPALPVFPKEAVGVGAKWQATRTMQFKPAGPQQPGIEMTHVTDYEFVGKKGTATTLKAKTTVTGKDQDIGGAKIQKITGSGSQDITLEDGALYPTYTSTVEFSLNVVEKDQPTEEHSFKLSSSVTAKAK